MTTIELLELDFDSITLADVTTIVGMYRADIADTALQYYQGDHWGKDAKGWMGPRPPETETGAKEIMASIKTAFVSKNVVKEVIGRHRSGVLGKEPGWAFTVTRPLAQDEEPTQEEQDLIDEIEAALTEWWDDRDAHRLLQQALESLLYAGKATLRLFIPPGRLQNGFVPSGLTLPEALKLIFLGVPEVGQASVYTDPDFMEDIGVYTYTRKGIQGAEVSYLVYPETEIGQPVGEPRTVLRRLGTGAAERVASDPADPEQGFVDRMLLDLNGHILLHQMRRDPLITSQVVQNQRLLNLALTMLGRNVVQAGFLERIILNGQMPEEITQEYNVTTGEMEEVRKEGVFEVGPGKTAYIPGQIIVDEVTGKATIANASVVYRDPVPVGTFVETKEEAYRNILEETHQLHALLAGDAAATGISRVMARTDFIDDLKLTAPIIQKALRWMLETVLYMAAALADDEARVKGVRASAAVKLDPGPMTNEERASIQSLYGASIIPLETALTLLGFDDPDAIIAILRTEIDTSLEAWKIRAEILQVLTQFSDVEQAALAIGIAEEIAKKLATSVVVEGPEVSPAPEPQPETDEFPQEGEEGEDDGTQEDGDNPFGQRA